MTSVDSLSSFRNAELEGSGGSSGSGRVGGGDDRADDEPVEVEEAGEGRPSAHGSTGSASSEAAGAAALNTSNDSVVAALVSPHTCGCCSVRLCVAKGRLCSSECRAVWYVTHYHSVCITLSNSLRRRRRVPIVQQRATSLDARVSVRVLL